MWTYGQALKYLDTTRHVTLEDSLAKLEEFWEEVGQADPKLRYGNNNASQLFRIGNLVLVARTLEALPPDVSKDFIEKVKNRVHKYSALKPDSDLFKGVIDRNQQIIKIWERAVHLEDGLNYNEPPDWYYPVRESLGAAYYRQGNFGEAETAFCKDLQIPDCDYENQKIHKMNGRSLFGLIMSLDELKRKNGGDSEKQETLSSSGVSNSIGTETSKTEFCVEPKGGLRKLCEEFKEAWKNAPVEPSLETM
jgi:tetratricopeptide (TPR) repeat protein